MGDGSLSFLLFSISLIKLRIIKIPKKYKHPSKLSRNFSKILQILHSSIRFDVFLTSL